MNEEEQNDLIDEVVIDPSIVLKETANTLKKLVESGVIIPIDIREETRKEIAVFESNYHEMLDSDFTTAHKNILILIEKGMNSLNTLLVVAASSDNPRSYEVAAIWLQTIAELNKDLLFLHENQTKIVKLREDKSNPQTVNNNLFIGSPKDVLARLKNGESPNGIANKESP